MEKEKRTFRVASVVVVLALIAVVLTGCAQKAPGPEPAPTAVPTSVPTPAPTVKLTYNAMLLETMIGGAAQREWCEEVMKRSGGQVKIDFFPGGKLYGYIPAERALASGQVDITQFAGMEMGGIAELTALPMLFKSWKQIAEYHQKGGLDIVARSVAPLGMKPLWVVPISAMTGLYRKPVKTMDDVKGLKVRGPLPAVIEFLGLLGAASVHTETSEVYQALILGTIDGVVTTSESHLERKWYEGAKYWVDTPMGMRPNYCFINLSVWNKLPRAVQNTMLEVSKDVEAKALAKAEENEKNIAAGLAKVANAYSLPSDEAARWAKKASAVWDAWGKKDPYYAEALELFHKLYGK